MFKEHPASGRTLIVGFGRFGRNLLLAIVKDYIEPLENITHRLHLTVNDRDAMDHIASLQLSWPHIDYFCSLELLEIGIGSLLFEKVDFLYDENEQCRFNNIYVCMDTDSLNLSAGLML